MLEQPHKRGADDGWTPPGPLVGDTTLEAVRRLYDALRPTQSRHQYDHAARQQRDITPNGPRWYAADGRYELAAISFVDVDDADVAQLAAAAGELGRPGGDPDVREAVEMHEQDDRPSGAGAIASREHERRRLVVTAARIAGLLDLQTTADTELLHTVWRDAGGTAAGRIVLTTEQEQAYHRLVDRLTAISTLGDPLVRWAMGTRDHH